MRLAIPLPRSSLSTKVGVGSWSDLWHLLCYPVPMDALPGTLGPGSPPKQFVNASLLDVSFVSCPGDSRDPGELAQEHKTEG